MDERTRKTPNPKCQLFFKNWLVNGLCGIVFNRFYRLETQSLMVGIWTQLVNCCHHGRRNYTCVLLPLYLFSDLHPSQTKCTVYTDSVWLCLYVYERKKIVQYVRVVKNLSFPFVFWFCYIRWLDRHPKRIGPSHCLYAAWCIGSQASTEYFTHVCSYVHYVHGLYHNTCTLP